MLRSESVLREGVDAVNDESLERLLAIVTDDFRGLTPGNSPLAGPRHGKQAIGEFFATMFANSGGTVKTTVRGLLANERHTVLFLDYTAERDGKPIAFRLAAFCVHDHEGQITESWFLPNDIEAFDTLAA